MMQFDSKQTYLIIHKTMGYALETSDQALSKSGDVQMGPVNVNNKRQLWLVQTKQGGTLEVVNGFTDNVLTEDGRKVTLKRGAGNKHQLWEFQFLKEGDFRIKRSKGDKEYICVSKGQVRLKEAMPAQADLWNFKPVTDNVNLNKSCFIIANDKRKLIDIPEASRREGEEIGLYTANYRYNQRWNILRAGEIYVIKSHFNGLNLEVLEQQYKNEQDIVQRSSHGKVNQFWIFERINPNDNVFRICCCYDRRFELAHHRDKLVLHKGKRYLWQIDGYFPE